MPLTQDPSFSALRTFLRLVLSWAIIGVTCLSHAQSATPSQTSAPKAAVTPAPNLSAYRLGSGDTLSIVVFGEEDMSVNKIRLTDAGTFLHPILGEMRVLGMTVGELERRVTEGLRGRYLVNPLVAVRIDEYRPFFLSGAVVKPGAYPYLPGLTVYKAASLGGGLRDTADTNRISIVSESAPHLGPQRATLDTPLNPGDSIEVAEYLPFFVNGMIYKPGGYPYQPGMNIQKAVSLAGGFKERASLSKIYVIRNGGSGQTAEKADLMTPIYQGDIITVEESFF